MQYFQVDVEEGKNVNDQQLGKDERVFTVDVCMGEGAQKDIGEEEIVCGNVKG